LIYQKQKAMTTINITLPTNKSGKQSVFTIQFSVLNFDSVIDAVSKVKNIEELYSSNLWKVI
jgi:hypothetical protein